MNELENEHEIPKFKEETNKEKEILQTLIDKRFEEKGDYDSPIPTIICSNLSKQELKKLTRGTK